MKFIAYYTRTYTAQICLCHPVHRVSVQRQAAHRYGAVLPEADALADADDPGALPGIPERRAAEHCGGRSVHQRGAELLRGVPQVGAVRSHLLV